jgi:hypothetical protein
MSCYSCPFCQSANQHEFTAEVNVHFPGVKGLNIPTVWIFPRLLVCMDCGKAEFTIPDAELRTVASRDYRSRAERTAA